MWWIKLVKELEGAVMAKSCLGHGSVTAENQAKIQKGGWTMEISQITIR